MGTVPAQGAKRRPKPHTVIAAVLIAVVVIAVVVITALLPRLLAGGSPQPTEASAQPSQVTTFKKQRFHEEQFVLKDGTVVTCLVNNFRRGGGDSISCDWDNAKRK